ncbi:MAG: beta-ribofuranosylaminobenzene 5'-phosphate synthase family protein [Burkholderiales bacterium]
MKRKLPKTSITVQAPARLHMGFVDLTGASARRFGSLGLTLEELNTRVQIRASESDVVEGQQAERAARYVNIIRERLQLPVPVHLTVERSIPEHAGLGSGTQLALAVGAALNELFDLGLSARQLAAMLDRGARSGIGVGAFEHGGFLLDGGKAQDDSPPPVICRLPFPAVWRILLIFDTAREGLHGLSEQEAFRSLPAFSEDVAGNLCRLALMRVLPALAESDLTEFGLAIAEIQAVVGDYFAPAQGGRYTSPRVAEALHWLEGEGVICVGQSSWGPTGFAVVDSDTVAYTLLRALKARRAQDSPIRFLVCRGRNTGAELTIERGVKTGAAYAG